MIDTAEELHPAIFRPMEVTLAALQAAGIDLCQATQAHFLLTNFTMGEVSYEIRGPFRGLDPTEAVRRRVVLLADFPLVVKAASAGAWDFGAAFEFGLATIIERLEARASGKRVSPRSRKRR